MHSTQKQTPSVLRQLRALTPHRNCGFEEALSVAENQANLLVDILRALDTQSEPIQISHVAALPRIKVVYAGNMPVSGMSHWSGREWVITIASRDPLTCQRFTVLHELKHIIDHGFASNLYCGTGDQTCEEQAEEAADYFAGCALISRHSLRRALDAQDQNPVDLVQHFGVSPAVVRVRLAQTGLGRAVDAQLPRLNVLADESNPTWFGSQPSPCHTDRREAS